MHASQIWNSVVPHATQLLVGTMLCLTFAGCGSDGPVLVDVGGTVKLDGQTLPNAEVRFLPIIQGNEPARPASAFTDESGHYSLEYSTSKGGARPGKYRVYISTRRNAMPDVPAVPEKIPVVYNESTELTAEITDSQRTFDFDLKSDAGKIVQPRGAARSEG